MKRGAVVRILPTKYFTCPWSDSLMTVVRWDATDVLVEGKDGKGVWFVKSRVEVVQ